MGDHTIRALSADTWDAFATLVEKHNGVWGGCWDTWFHAEDAGDGKKALGNPAFKRQMVDLGIAHAALVFEGEAAIGWCEYGTPAELPRIYHRKEWEAGTTDPPRYRLTCFFIDRDHRREGVAAEALAGAIDLIARAGGGSAEAYPHDLPPGKKVSSSFLYNGTRTLFERAGFEFPRPLGTSKCVMRRDIAAS